MSILKIEKIQGVVLPDSVSVYLKDLNEKDLNEKTLSIEVEDNDPEALCAPFMGRIALCAASRGAQRIAFYRVSPQGMRVPCNSYKLEFILKCYEKEFRESV
ncbi:MAG: hypothetical protein F6K42_14710 [Leptolyngbya sp. SIO1D8]|nr:hypothetical protein [Leptolyngbya sp. SIO1D8]